MSLKSKNVYYIGSKQTDIAADIEGHSDKFFAGSVTIFGNNEKGNISYNVRHNKQFNIDDPNLVQLHSEIYKEFIDKHCREIVATDPSAVFLPYNNQFAEKVPTEFKNRIICTNDPKYLSFLNSKFNFKNLMQKCGVRQAKFQFLMGSEILSLLHDKTFPNCKEVVIQTEYSAGGKGTYIATKETFADKQYVDSVYAQIDPAKSYVVSDYIENVCSASFRVQISDNETAMYPPTVQIMHGATFIGADPVKFSEFKPNIKQQVTEMAQKFGDIIRNIEQHVIVHDVENKKLRGCFGIDFIIGKNEDVYAIETNPRFTGCSGLDNILSRMSKTGCVYEHAYQASKGQTNYADKFKKILPCAVSSYAPAEQSSASKNNQEGFDKVANREAGAYTYRVFEKKISELNTFDNRVDEKQYWKKFGATIGKRLAKIQKGIKQHVIL